MSGKGPEARGVPLRRGSRARELHHWY